jgi:hypothetical protein
MAVTYKMLPANAQVEPMTPKQLAYIEALLPQLATKIAEDTSGSEIVREALSVHDTIKILLAQSNVSKQQGSRAIEMLLHWNKRSFAPRPVPVVRDKAPIGVYKRGEDIYRVIKGRQSQNTYAQKLVVNNQTNEPVWDYAGAMIYELKVEELISPEVAAQMGRSVGYCVICGRFLTDAESVAKGIGPVCEKNTSRTYAQYQN